MNNDDKMHIRRMVGKIYEATQDLFVGESYDNIVEAFLRCAVMFDIYFDAKYAQSDTEIEWGFDVTQEKLIGTLKNMKDGD